MPNIQRLQSDLIAAATDRLADAVEIIERVCDEAAGGITAETRQMAEAFRKRFEEELED